MIEPPKTPPSPRPEDCMSDDEVNNVIVVVISLSLRTFYLYEKHNNEQLLDEVEQNIVICLW